MSSLPLVRLNFPPLVSGALVIAGLWLPSHPAMVSNQSITDPISYDIFLRVFPVTGCGIISEPPDPTLLVYTGTNAAILSGAQWWAEEGCIGNTVIKCEYTYPVYLSRLLWIHTNSAGNSCNTSKLCFWWYWSISVGGSLPYKWDDNDTPHHRSAGFWSRSAHYYPRSTKPPNDCWSNHCWGQ